MTLTPQQAAQISGGVWNMDQNHSLIEFAAKHFEIAYVKGRFKSFQGKITVDEQDLLRSTVELSIDAASLDSQAMQMREDLIKGEEMLEVDKYPTITFRSTRIEQQGAATFLVTGDLTMRGITKQVQIPMQFGGLVNTRMGPRAGFSGELTLNKSDFQVPFNREFEPGRYVVGDNIKVELQVEAAPGGTRAIDFQVMADQSTIDALLEGAFDTHIHSAPDVLPRKFNDLELAERFKQRKMAGFVLKSHYICTADRATLVRQVVPEVQAFGAIALNNSVGGLNPLALDIAGRLGTRVCWLPSVDNANELENVQGQRDESKLPYWMSIAREMRALGIAGNWINVTEGGAVTNQARQCLEIVAKHDMVLATSHIRPSEMLPVVKAARDARVERIIITHPEFPTTLLSIDQQRELARHGVFFERCFTTPNTGKISWQQVYSNIREVGPESTILATDLGQTTAPYPDEGLATFIGNLLDNGFSEREVQRMVRDNPAQLLGAKTAATVA